MCKFTKNQIISIRKQLHILFRSMCVFVNGLLIKNGAEHNSCLINNTNRLIMQLIPAKSGAID